MDEGSSSGETHVDDAFGVALQEYYQGEGPGEYTTERDDGKEVSAEISHYFEPYEQWAAPTKSALEFVRSGDTVLDVGCGAGRHALWLQERGHEVVAIDRSRSAIDVCRDRGVESCEVMDMTDLRFEDDTFDTILVIGTIIGLGGDPDDVRGYFEEFDRITTDRGRVIADSQNPFIDDVEDTEYLRENRIDDRNASTIRFRVRYRELVEDWLEIAVFGEDELARVVDDTPWSITDTVETEPGEGWYSIATQWYFAILDKEYTGRRND